MQSYENSVVPYAEQAQQWWAERELLRQQIAWLVVELRTMTGLPYSIEEVNHGAS